MRPAIGTAKPIRQRRPLRDVGHEITPGLAFGGRHGRPALGVFQKHGLFRRGHARKFGEGMDTFAALRRRQFLERLQGLLHLPAFGFRQGVERLFFFGGREFKKLVESGGDLLAFGFGKRVPMRPLGFAGRAAKIFRRAAARIHLREIAENVFVLQKFLLQRRRQNGPFIEPVLDKFAHILRNLRQPRRVIRRRFLEQRHQIPAQIRRAQAQLALVGFEPFIFVDFGDDAVADFWRTVGQESLAFIRRHGQQLPETVHGRFSKRGGGRPSVRTRI